jgi:hypothetical protein
VTEAVQVVGRAADVLTQTNFQQTLMSCRRSVITAVMQMAPLCIPLARAALPGRRLDVARKLTW